MKYTYREERSFEESKRSLGLDDQLFDDAYFGVQWVIAREPTEGVESEAGDIWVAHSKKMRNLPALVFFYAVQGDLIRMLWVEEAKALE